MALHGELHGKQPGRKTVYRKVTVPDGGILNEDFNNELVSVETVQLTKVDVQTLTEAHEFAAISGTVVSITGFTANPPTPSTNAYELEIRVVGQAPA